MKALLVLLFLICISFDAQACKNLAGEYLCVDGLGNKSTISIYYSPSSFYGYTAEFSISKRGTQIDSFMGRTSDKPVTDSDGNTFHYRCMSDDLYQGYFIFNKYWTSTFHYADYRTQVKIEKINNQMKIESTFSSFFGGTLATGTTTCTPNTKKEGI